ncbi:MAG: tetratricopeptide repeat protein [Verrucomicrobia bacterium]|nr:tetratricopeptide repeat protein [Verrucomicrobiota bacterium]
MFPTVLADKAAAQKPALPKPPAPAGEVVSIASLNRLLNETDVAFEAKDYATASAKIEKLIKALGPKPTTSEEMMEMLYFNNGLAYMLGDKPAEAEAAFTRCVTRYPQGAYATRCFLGIGKVCIAQKTPAKNELAIKALKRAMEDWKYSSEAGLVLGQLYGDMGKRKEALAVYRSLMGADVRTSQQTAAAVGVIDLLADNSNTDDLVYYLDRLMNMAGVRDAIAWYSNQVCVRGDKALSDLDYDTALAIYQTVPSRKQILHTQTLALEIQRKKLRTLEATVAEEKKEPDKPRSIATELIASLKPGIAAAEGAQTAIEGMKDFDSALVMRRGRCFFHLKRYQEARVCFDTIRTKYPTCKDAKAAAYAEIVTMDTLKKSDGLLPLCQAYLKAYPDADNAEAVATLAGELLVEEKKWEEVGEFYANLEKRFPKSVNLDRFIFYQALAHFQDGDFALSTPLFEKVLKNFPKSALYENALYHVAMAHFLSNEEKQTKARCTEYLSNFPKGLYAGDMRYRLSFIDSNDDRVKPGTIITDLKEFMKDHPDDVSNGSMRCLLADTYKKKFNQTKDVADETAALDAFEKAVESKSPDDVIQYALDSATAILQGRKDWNAIAELHGSYMRKNPDSQLALLSAAMVVKMKIRSGKGAEGAELLASTLQERIGNPAIQQVEYLLDELIKTLVPPRKKAGEVDAEAIDSQLVDVLNKIIGNSPNATATARLYYARARLSQLLNRSEHTDRSDLYLKGIATNCASDPAVLSPTLLSVCAGILLKEGNLDGAEAMFKRLADSYKDSLFADAGPVGLGTVALARKQPDAALRIFDDTLTNNRGSSKFKEATLGKLQALIDLNQYEAARTMAQEIVGDKMFHGEAAGNAYLLLARSYRAEAAKAASGSDEAKELLAKAHGTYQRIYVAYQSLPVICAEAYWQAYEVAKEMNEYSVAAETLKALAKNPRLANTQRGKDASKLTL